MLALILAIMVVVALVLVILGIKRSRLLYDIVIGLVLVLLLLASSYLQLVNRP